MEQDRQRGVKEPVQRNNWTTIVLIGALILLVLIVAYFVTRGNTVQDKLTNGAASSVPSAQTASDKMCASKSTYDVIKRDLFRRAAQLRGSDQAAYEQLSTVAVLRMENPVMESEDNSTGSVNCSGSVFLDLPPNVAVEGGRHTLTADIDYAVQPVAGGTGQVLLRNAGAIVTPLATLSRTEQPAQEPTMAPVNEGESVDPAAGAMPPATPSQEATPRLAGSRPSFDCGQAKTRGEIAICSNAGLAALDRNVAAQFLRSMAAATPDQQVLLRRTRGRFLGYRDRCPDNRCIGDAYVGRMREIRDIMEGRWQPPR